jgi:hypothetical protein
MPPPALEVVRVVLRDMGVDARLKWVDDGYVWLKLPGEPRVAVWIEGNEHGDLVHIADQLQNELSETTAYWGRALPLCPGHTHPTSPERLGDDAWWMCPVSGERVARIGELASDTRP